MGDDFGDLETIFLICGVNLWVCGVLGLDFDGMLILGVGTGFTKGGKLRGGGGEGGGGSSTFLTHVQRRSLFSLIMEMEPVDLAFQVFQHAVNIRLVFLAVILVVRLNGVEFVATSLVWSRSATRTWASLDTSTTRGEGFGVCSLVCVVGGISLILIGVALVGVVALVTG